MKKITINDLREILAALDREEITMSKAVEILNEKKGIERNLSGELTLKDFDNFRKKFKEKYFSLVGEEVTQASDVFSMNEIFGDEIEAAILGKRYPIETLKELWGFTSHLSFWLSSRTNKYKLSKSDKMLLDLILNDFLFDKQEAKNIITEEGVKRLNKIRWSFAQDLLPELRGVKFDA